MMPPFKHTRPLRPNKKPRLLGVAPAAGLECAGKAACRPGGIGRLVAAAATEFWIQAERHVGDTARGEGATRRIGEGGGQVDARSDAPAALDFSGAGQGAGKQFTAEAPSR